MIQAPSIASVTPTLCELLDVPRPAGCVAESFPLFPGEESWPRVKRALVFAADAIGAHLVRSFDSEFMRVLSHAPIRVDAHAVMPSVTPVCFASMFTGAPPEIHGLRRYEKPVLACDTLFDAMARANRRVAIVAVEDSSMDRIFRNRAIDYFTESYDQEAVERVHALISEDRHDLIVVYQQEYDDQMHATVPRSPEALRAMRNHIANFDYLAKEARGQWAGTHHALAFVSDHGTHIDAENGRGTHGSDSLDDLEVTLFWGVEPRKMRDSPEPLSCAG
jgi:predicted AlkP superfamily pyrophosphatase or phosphodiesterase